MPRQTIAQRQLIRELAVEDPPHRIGVAMREIRRGAMGLPTDQFLPKGIGPGQQYDALGLLVIEHPMGCRMRELAVALRVDASTATRAVDRLVRHGLADRSRSDQDARAQIVEATAHGMALYLEAARAMSPVWRSTLDAALSRSDQLTLADLLDRLILAFDDLNRGMSPQRLEES